MSPLPVELFPRQLRRVFICAMLRAVCLALLALRRRAYHVKKVCGSNSQHRMIFPLWRELACRKCGLGIRSPSSQAE